MIGLRSQVNTEVVVKTHEKQVNVIDIGPHPSTKHCWDLNDMGMVVNEMKITVSLFVASVVK